MASGDSTYCYAMATFGSWENRTSLVKIEHMECQVKLILASSFTKSKLAERIIFDPSLFNQNMALAKERG